jgi:ectoine hydroxylase-related dioxygenase (phytanoyl-CoA dioxygenase family)
MTTDLSIRHELVGRLFEFPQTAAAWQKYLLNEDELAFYRENGYVAGVRILTDPQVEMLREELEEFFDPQHAGRELWYEYHSNESADPKRVLFHALGAWRIRAGFHDVLWHPAFTVAASQLLDGAVRFWHDQLFCKPARHGGVVAWHQDYSYWTRTKPLAHLTCWIGLDDSTRENGCLHYVPGSHQWDLLPITGLAGDMDAIREVLNAEQWEAFNNPVAVELKQGECSFHHGLTIHGSFENSSERPRRAVVINAFRDGVCSASDEPLLGGVPPMPAGKPMGGQFFPLLLDPADVGLG